MSVETERVPLQVEKICKSFQSGEGANAVSVLRDVSLSVKKGEFVAVMGPSGSGKSTLLHIIAGLISADAGKIVVEGDDIQGKSDARLTQMRRRKLCVVFQSFNLIPSLSVADNITLPVSADGKRPDRAKLLAIAEKLGIADKLERYPGSLSGGEQQRAAIARALFPEPAVILADEPTGSLDTVAGQAFCKLMRELCEKDGRTIVMVTHEPNVAAWADRVLVLRDGAIAGILPTSPGGTNAQELAVAYQELLSQSPEA